MMKFCADDAPTDSDGGIAQHHHGGRDRDVRGCRVTVGGEMKFVCVDGPEFDGHKVDFDT